MDDTDHDHTVKLYERFLGWNLYEGEQDLVSPL